MLIRNMPQNLYAEDSTLGTPTPTPDTQQAQSGASGEEEKLSITQKELNRIAAKEKKDGKAQAEADVLQKLGVSNLEEAIAALTAKRQGDEAAKTEAQKLQDALSQAKQETAAALQRAVELEKASRLKERDSELKALLSAKAIDPSEVLIFLKAAIPEKLDALLDENGHFDSEAAAKIIADYQTTKPHWFKDTSPGSSLSNRDGRPPQANEEAKKALTAMTAKSMKGF